MVLQFEWQSYSFWLKTFSTPKPDFPIHAFLLVVRIDQAVHFNFFITFGQNQMNMKFEVDNKDKVVVIKTKIEKLDAIHAPELKSEMVMQNKSGHKNMILDLSETRYIDSSGLSAVLVGNRVCRDSNGSFVICGLQPTVQKLITISQLESVLKITPTVDEAVDLVYMEEVEREL
jgi:anti-anti-sigma factor